MTAAAPPVYCEVCGHPCPAGTEPHGWSADEPLAVCQRCEGKEEGMGDNNKFQRCPICKEFDFPRLHRCKPVYEVRGLTDDDYDMEWREVRAHGPQAAAEQWLSEFHEYETEMRATAIVRDPDGLLTRWQVDMEITPYYSASQKSVTDDVRAAIAEEPAP